MKCVQLVVTGRCERLALHHSLHRSFPSADWKPPIARDPFTSTPITDPLPGGVATLLDKFAAGLVGAVDSTDEETLVVGVDDLELHHTGRLETVATALTQSVVRVLERWSSSEAKRERLAGAVARRCSFHLLVPMVEAYFFAEAAALTRAGASLPSRFDPFRDVEDFEVDDPEFGTTDRRHPKRYVSFLSQGQYKETRDGVAALATLDWPTVLVTHAHSQVARALVDDVADFLETDRPAGRLSLVTARSTHRLRRVLRNA